EKLLANAFVRTYANLKSSDYNLRLDKNAFAEAYCKNTSLTS
ncbi:8656_t:CDS:1, partial [Cetraspora pellucida]